MTKKDYELILHTIKSMKVPHNIKVTVFEHFAKAFQEENPGFDLAKFAVELITKPKLSNLN